MPMGTWDPSEILQVDAFPSLLADATAGSSTWAVKLVQTRGAAFSFVPWSVISVVLPGAIACGVTCNNVGCATADRAPPLSQPAATSSAAAISRAEQRVIGETLVGGQTVGASRARA